MIPKAVISINKQVFGRGDELIIHVWFERDFPAFTQLSIKNPSGNVLDSARLKGKRDTTETFAFTLGGMTMTENGKHSIMIDWHGIESVKTFEYFDSGNVFDSSNYT